ncbi:MAG: MarR family transcriptional regulator [Actinomycetota bacterium]
MPPPDHVDHIIEQWARERPDVDVSAIAVIGRISRIEQRLQPLLSRVFARHGLAWWEYDVLAALRRTGPPFELTAGQLWSSLMLTSGAITNRLDRLEGRGLVERLRDPEDARRVLARLTDAGRATIDDALVDHAANETHLLASLSDRDRATLVRLLRKLHQGLDEVDDG